MVTEVISLLKLVHLQANIGFVLESRVIINWVHCLMINLVVMLSPRK